MQFARILDFHHVRWEYEPKSFPIEWDEEGRAIQSFTPDFYLPDEDGFVEITTRKQSLVSKKRRKVRLFQDHYPDMAIKLLYRRDYLHLVYKYGLDSGPASEEQPTPVRHPGPPHVIRLRGRDRRPRLLESS